MERVVSSEVAVGNKAESAVAASLVDGLLMVAHGYRAFGDNRDNRKDGRLQLSMVM